jgi:hypothetical protein
MKDAEPGCRHEPLDGRLLAANRERCPECGSKNTEEDDGGMKCVDCGTHFRIVNMQEVFGRLLKSQKKTFDTLAGVDNTEKQVKPKVEAVSHEQYNYE